VAAALSFVAVTRIRRAQALIAAARDWKGLLDAAPARPVVLHPDGRLEVDKLLLRDLGLSRDQLETCRTDKSLVTALNAIKERGRNLGIVGTPNFFINGRLVRSTLTLNDVKALIDPIISGASTTTAQTTPQKT